MNTTLDVYIRFMHEDVCVSVSEAFEYMRVWGSEEDVGEVLFLHVFVFSSPPVWSSGLGATEGKINTEQTSPGTQAIPRGILGMWLRMSGLPLLPHPENCPPNPKIWGESALGVCTDEEGDLSVLAAVKLS